LNSTHPTNHPVERLRGIRIADHQSRQRICRRPDARKRVIRDGFVTIWTPSGELLDVPRFVAIVTRHAAKPTDALRDAILGDVVNWCDNQRKDDMSLVVVRRIR
jgi:hypothetical protein